MLERRANPIGESATAEVPRTTVGRLRLGRRSISEQNRQFHDRRGVSAAPGEPSAVSDLGQWRGCWPLLDRTDDRPAMFRSADLIPMPTGSRSFTLSRLKSSRPLPSASRPPTCFTWSPQGAGRGLTFYMLGADEAENEAAVANVGKMYPGLKIVGHSHGLYKRRGVCGPRSTKSTRWRRDYLWVALGVPNEQAFVEQYTPYLSNVGVIKTSGGLFNFLSGSRVRAPKWMQNCRARMVPGASGSSHAA